MGMDQCARMARASRSNPAGDRSSCLVWRWTEQRLGAGYAAWAVERRAAGWTVEARPALGGGWPLAATLTLPNVALKGGESDVPGGFSWSAERAVLRIRPAAPPDAIDCRRGRATPEHRGLSRNPLYGGPAGRHGAGGTRPGAAKGGSPGEQYRGGHAVRKRGGASFDGRVSAGPPRDPAIAAARGAGSRLRDQRRGDRAAARHALAARQPRLVLFGRGGLERAGTARRRLGGSGRPVAGRRRNAGDRAFRSGLGTARLVRERDPRARRAAPAQGRCQRAAGRLRRGPGCARGQRRHHAPRRYRREGDPELDRAGARERRLRPVEVPLTLQDRTLSVRQIPLARVPPLAWPAG